MVLYHLLTVSIYLVIRIFLFVIFKDFTRNSNGECSNGLFANLLDDFFYAVVFVVVITLIILSKKFQVHDVFGIIDEFKLGLKIGIFLFIMFIIFIILLLFEIVMK